jgi:hypothetical protein
MENINIFELIYYGSPDLQVNLTPVEGKKFIYDQNDILNINDDQSINSSLINKYGLRHLGHKYENVYIIGIPANDVICKKYNSELQPCKGIGGDILDNCLIKTKQFIEEGKSIVGYKSGMRSAVLPFNGRYYRLKGCGNELQGFNWRYMGFPKDCIDVRGCQFRNTAFREVYFSDVINNILTKYGFEVANKPLGVWLYGNIEDKQLEITNDFNKIEKFCSVYEVVGEKRLGAQLMPGVEKIVSVILKEYIKGKDESAVKLIIDLFPAERIAEKKNESGEIIFREINPTMDYVPLVELNKDEGDDIKSLFEKYNIYSQDQKELINVLTYDFKDNLIYRNFDIGEGYINILDEYCSKEIYDKFNKLNPNSKSQIFDKLTNFITNNNGKNLLQVVGLLYSRIGWECGRIKRIMQDNDINWGTYEDLPFRLHCNAHTDNYVIIPKGKAKNNNLLAILDFDLAFFRENFISILNEREEDYETYGKYDKFLYDMYINLERQHIEWELAGSENMHVYDFFKEDFKASEPFEFVFKGIVNILRDTSVLYFRMGYLFKDYPLEEKYKENYDNLYELIDLALIFAYDFIG